jgi:hypothetical protein
MNLLRDYRRDELQESLTFKNALILGTRVTRPSDLMFLCASH